MRNPGYLQMRYAATAHCIVKSLDSGLTWSTANSGVTGTCRMLAIDP
jgi:hypothetical protein